jgi:nucleotide-binding universal stress UspA family protein
MEDKLITLATQSYYRAQLLKERLEKNNIECFLQNPDMAGRVTNEGIKVRIRENDFDKALDIAEAVNKEYGEEEIKIPEEQLTVDQILVPVSFTDYSQKACFYALKLAERYKANIHLFHAFYNPYIDTTPVSDTLDYSFNYDQYVLEIEKETREKLENIVKELKNEINKKGIAGVSVDHTMVPGNIDERIIEINEDIKPDLIVIGTRGADKKNNDFMGRVTARIIENTEVPVLAIPEDTRFDDLHKLNIMYATNFDDSDFSALRKLMTLTAPFDPKLYCVHVENEPDNPVLNAKMNKLKEYFEKHYNDIKIECDIIKNEDVLAGIQDFINHHKIGILAMSVHKRNVIVRLFKPSMAKKVFFHTDVPLLVFHF